MTENLKYCILGKVKLVVGRFSKDDKWEIISRKFWHDGFDTDLTAHMEDYVDDVFCMGGPMEDVESILESSAGEGLQVFEIVAELHHESWKSWTDCGYEYDAREWLEKEKFREVKGNDLEFLKEVDPFAWKDFWGEEVDNAGNG